MFSEERTSCQFLASHNTNRTIVIRMWKAGARMKWLGQKKEVARNEWEKQKMLERERVRIGRTRWYELLGGLQKLGN